MSTMAPLAAVPESPGSRASGSRWLAVLRTPVGAVAGLGIVLVVLLAIFAPILWSQEANTPHVADLLQGPSSEHWVGTDNLGRDIFYRVLVATRLSVELALLATLIAVVAGLLLGTAGVVLGRRADRFLAATVNIAVAFPGVLLALFFAVIFGVGAKGAVLAIGFAGAPAFARLAQTLVATVAERDFIAAARIGGVSRIRILTRHVLPNIAEPLIVNATIGAGSALAGLRQPVLPRHRCAAAELRLGRAARRRAWPVSTSNRSPRSRRASPSCSPGWRSTCSVRRWPRWSGSARRSAGYRPAAPSGSDRPLPMRRQTRTPTTTMPSSTSPTSSVTFPGRGQADPSRPRRDVQHRPGRGGRGRRRVRLGQVADRAGGGAPDRGARTGRRVAPALPRHRPAHRQPPHPPAAARHVVRDGVPGSDDLVQPDPPGRTPARRGQPAARGVVPQRSAGPRSRPVARGARAGGRAAGAPVPARVLRRHAAARDDRHGRHGDAGPHRRRRTDDRARRDRAAPGARPARRRSAPPTTWHCC